MRAFWWVFVLAVALAAAALGCAWLDFRPGVAVFAVLSLGTFFIAMGVGCDVERGDDWL